MDAAQYLRKSRMEEGMDTEEVLSKHRKALAEYAATHGVHIIETYYEVVSGESLYARPEMLRLLEDVEEGKYDAVLVMDLDRLSRGRMKDQGIILDAFRESGTLIVTPEKTYDLSDDLDDEMAEFKTFMSRREYKIINKRLRRGLRQTIRDGCYVANAPYGYRKVTVDRKPTLEIVEEEAKFVRMMYEMYVDGFGCVSIARHVNSLGAKPRRTDAFSRSSVANILKNPTYIGKIVWDQKKHIRKGSKGNPKHITIYQPREQWTIVDGIHPAIVSKELYDKAQAVMAGRYIPASNDGTVRSPLAGLVRCANCGHHMQRMAVGTKQPYLLCNTPGCCASAKFDLVEQAILDHLAKLLAELSVAKPAEAVKGTDYQEARLETLQKEAAAAEVQKGRLYDLLEQGVYDVPTFRERMEKVKARLSLLDREIASLQRAIRAAQQTDPAVLAARIQAVLDAYQESDPAHRNALLRSVFEVVWYAKDKKTKPNDFRLRFDLNAN